MPVSAQGIDINTWTSYQTSSSASCWRHPAHSLLCSTEDTAVPAGTHNIFEKGISLVALWMLGYSNAETAKPGMKSVQSASSSKQSDAPAEAAPGGNSGCQSIWHQAAVLSAIQVWHAHISCWPTRDQMTQARLQKGLPLCWHTLHCSTGATKTFPSLQSVTLPTHPVALAGAAAWPKPAPPRWDRSAAAIDVRISLANAGPLACSKPDPCPAGCGWWEQQQQQWAASGAVAAAGAGAARDPATGHAAAAA